MLIKVRAVDALEKAQLRGMLSAYLHELSQYGDVDLTYRFFDSYWSDADRWAYFIETQESIAGFFLVNTWAPSGKGADFALAECYLLPAFRGAGYGKTAFSSLLQSRPGVWELSVMSRNLPARAFWQRTLATVGVGELERIQFEDRLVYRFSSEQ
jgi:predicted acetyltransferase